MSGNRICGMSKANCVPLLKALADRTRWQIVRGLLERELTVTELTKLLNVTQYNVSKHLRILREAGIVRTQREGKHVRCSVKKDLRRKIRKKKDQLDLGCCSFQLVL